MATPSQPALNGIPDMFCLQIIDIIDCALSETAMFATKGGMKRGRI